jgi:putative hydrolase of the HAD superfamily
MFDFGNVLVNFETQKFYNFLKSKQKTNTSKKIEEIFISKPISDYDLGLISTSQMFEKLRDEFSLNLTLNEFLENYTAVINPDFQIINLVQAVRKNGIKTALISNINICYYQYVQQEYPEVFEHFDYLMLSYQHKFKKPDHRMWEIPSIKLGVSPENCFFVDDVKLNIIEFQNWSKNKGEAFHYNVINDNFLPNGRLKLEKTRLILKMINLGMLTIDQAAQIL